MLMSSSYTKSSREPRRTIARTDTSLVRATQDSGNAVWVRGSQPNDSLPKKTKTRQRWRGKGWGHHCLWSMLLLYTTTQAGHVI